MASAAGRGAEAEREAECAALAEAAAALSDADQAVVAAWRRASACSAAGAADRLRDAVGWR